MSTPDPTGPLPHEAQLAGTQVPRAGETPAAPSFAPTPGTALAGARGSRLSPAYRDGQPIAATALLTLHFAPERATCPGMQAPDREPPSGNRPPPRVTWIDQRPAPRAEWWGTLSREAG